MQPTFEKVKTDVNQSIYVNHLKAKKFPSPLHFHPEIEILLIIEGTGTRIIGDSVGRFEPGDLIMIKGGISHVWYSDEQEQEKKKPAIDPETLYIQFKLDIFGNEFIHLPELGKILKLIQRSKRGLRVIGQTRDKVEELMFSIRDSSGFSRILDLLKILNLVSLSQDYTLLASPLAQPYINLKDSEKLNRIYEFILNNYEQEITLQEISSMANLSTSAFCRYFKKNTHKTFIQFLNEIRIGHACRFLLDDESYSVSYIGNICGYNNISYFIRQFTKITGLTPLAYRKQFNNE